MALHHHYIIHYLRNPRLHGALQCPTLNVLWHEVLLLEDVEGESLVWVTHVWVQHLALLCVEER